MGKTRIGVFATAIWCGTALETSAILVADDVYTSLDVQFVEP
jgi:hypothetical protein